MKLAKLETHGYGGFMLDVRNIGDTSVDEREIRLPYTGIFPTPYAKATISFRVTPMQCNVVLTTEDSERHNARYVVDAERDEVERILCAVFFRKCGTSYYTRFDNGLDRYWIGRYQAEYSLWYEFGTNPIRVCEVLDQLSTEQRRSLYKSFEAMERRDTERA